MKKYANLNYRIIDLLNKEYGEINIIMGSDLLEKLYNFDNYQYLLEKYSFTIIPREQVNVKALIEKKYQAYQDKFSIINRNLENINEYSIFTS